MSARAVLYLLLLVVAVAAAVLSFAALRDLALVCGFAPWLAWLLPVVVDAGAAAGSLVWLGGWSTESARRFACALALALLGLSVAANALGHGLAAFGMAPAWWVVVVVSAVAPAVLGAVVHLAVLVGRPDTALHPSTLDERPESTTWHPAVEAVELDGLYDEHGLSRRWAHAPVAPHRDRAGQLIAEGAGRRRLARELGISEYEARQLIDRTRTTHPGPADIGPDENSTPSTSTPSTSTPSTSTAQDAAPVRVHAVNGSGRALS